MNPLKGLDLLDAPPMVTSKVMGSSGLTWILYGATEFCGLVSCPGVKLLHAPLGAPLGQQSDGEGDSIDSTRAAVTEEERPQPCMVILFA